MRASLRTQRPDGPYDPVDGRRQGIVNLAAVGSPGSGGDGCSATIELLHVAARRYNAGPRRLIRNLQECLGRPRLGGLFCVSRTSSMSNPQNL
jgi:hypothetical protein